MLIVQSLPKSKNRVVPGHDTECWSLITGYHQKLHNDFAQKCGCTQCRSAEQDDLSKSRIECTQNNTGKMVYSDNIIIVSEKFGGQATHNGVGMT